MLSAFNTEYHGYTNKATWLVPLWLDNEYESHTDRIGRMQSAYDRSSWEPECERELAVRTVITQIINEALSVSSYRELCRLCDAATLQSDLLGWYVAVCYDANDLMDWLESVGPDYAMEKWTMATTHINFEEITDNYLETWREETEKGETGDHCGDPDCETCNKWAQAEESEE